MTGLGTSQRRGADDDDAPSASASRGQRALRGLRAGVAAPEREFRLWPPQVTFDARPLAARARGVGASLTPAALWRNHRLFTIAACVSVIPRVIAALGFKPALLIQDSFSYMKQSVQLLPLSELRPAGYPLVLHLLQPFHSLLLVTTVQHLMGIALGVIIYAVLRWRGLPAWGAVLAAAPTLFDSRQIWLESSILPDTLFTLVLMIAVAILVVWPRPAIWQAVVVGLLVSWASAAPSLCGLSGIAHGLMAISALEMIKGQPVNSAERQIGWLTFAVLLFKAAFEALTGTMFLSFLDFGLLGSPVAVSHAGGIVGSLCVSLLICSSRGMVRSFWTAAVQKLRQFG